MAAGMNPVNDWAVRRALRAHRWSLDILSAEDATPKAILKGLYRSAQGCARRATLGARAPGPFTLKGFYRWPFPTILWGLTAAKGTNGIGGGGDTTPSGLGVPLGQLPRVARRAQPWAERYNPFGIGTPDPGLSDTITVPRDASLLVGGISKLQARALGVCCDSQSAASPAPRTEATI
jgi:hypothetical protein